MVGVERDRTCGRHVTETNAVHFELAARLFLIGIHVDAMLQRRHRCRRCRAPDLEQVGPPRKQVLLCHPQDLSCKLISHFRTGIRGRDHITAGDVDFVVEYKRDSIAGDGLVKIAVCGHDALDIGSLARLGHDDGIARPDGAGHDRAGIAPEIEIGAIDPLNRHPERFVLDIAIDIQILQILDQGRAGMPRHAFTALGDIVAIARGHRDRGDCLKPQRLGAFEIVGDNLVEAATGMFDQVHLVDSEDDVANAHHARDIGVTQRLHEHTLAGVDHHDRHIRSRRAGRHVAGVLLVPRRIGDNEFALLGREEAVSHINRDALLPLGLETIQQEREIDLVASCPVLAAIALKHIDLVLEQQLAVIEEASDEG